MRKKSIRVEKSYFQDQKDNFESVKLDRKKQSKGENKDTREGNNNTENSVDIADYLLLMSRISW